jgi:hypothetical protein
MLTAEIVNPGLTNSEVNAGEGSNRALARFDVPFVPLVGTKWTANAGG